MSEEGGSRGDRGYGKPPEEHRFKPGKSGNPRGRPPKSERSFTPRQISRDVLSITEKATKVRTSDGVISTTVIEAIYRRAVQKALEGHGPSIRLVLTMHERAIEDHYERHKRAFSFLELVEDEKVAKPVRAANISGEQRLLNSLRAKTRKP